MLPLQRTCDCADGVKDTRIRVHTFVLSYRTCSSWLLSQGTCGYLLHRCLKFATTYGRSCWQCCSLFCRLYKGASCQSETLNPFIAHDTLQKLLSRLNQIKSNVIWTSNIEIQIPWRLRDVVGRHYSRSTSLNAILRDLVILYKPQPFSTPCFDALSEQHQ